MPKLLRAALAIACLGAASVAEAKSGCTEGSGIGVALCSIADDPLSALALLFGEFGAYVGGAGAGLALLYNVSGSPADPAWRAMTYVAGGASIGGGALLLSLGAAGYYEPELDHLTTVGGVAVAVGALALASSLLTQGQEQAPVAAVSPSIIVDGAGRANVAVTLSLAPF